MDIGSALRSPHASNEASDNNIEQHRFPVLLLYGDAGPPSSGSAFLFALFRPSELHGSDRNHTKAQIVGAFALFVTFRRHPLFLVPRTGHTGDLSLCPDLLMTAASESPESEPLLLADPLAEAQGSIVVAGAVDSVSPDAETILTVVHVEGSAGDVRVDAVIIGQVDLGVVSCSDDIVSLAEAQAYYRHKFARQSVDIKHALTNKKVRILFRRDQTHCYSKKPVAGQTYSPLDYLSITRAERHLRVFNLERSRMMDRILPTIRDPAFVRLDVRPPDLTQWVLVVSPCVDGRAFQVCLEPAAHKGYNVRSAYPISKKEYDEKFALPEHTLK